MATGFENFNVNYNFKNASGSYNFSNFMSNGWKDLSFNTSFETLFDDLEDCDGENNFAYCDPLEQLGYWDLFRSDDVAKNKTASAIGDPHVTGADGVKAEFMPRGIYEMLNDKNLKINANLVQWGNNQNATVIGNVGININSNKVQVNADGSATLNGQNLNIQEGQFASLGNNTSITKQGNKFILQNAEYRTELVCNGDYIDSYVTSGDKGVYSDGVAPTGFLGDTFHVDGFKNPLQSMDKDGDGFIETEEATMYKKATLFA